MALLVQRDLREVGVDMQLETVSVNEFNRRIGTGDFEAVLIELMVGNTPSRALHILVFAEPTEFTGDTRIRNIDEAFDRIRHASNDTEYRQAFVRSRSKLLDDPPAIFLHLARSREP